MAEFRNRRASLLTVLAQVVTLAVLVTALPRSPAAREEKPGPLPPQAIEEARATVKAMTDRWRAGEVTSDQMALARYYLLEMQYRAGLVNHGAFCRSAKPELKAVADAFAEQDGQAGQKAKWQSQIAQMTNGAGACDGAVATAAALLFGITDSAYAASDVKPAEDLAKQEEQRYTEGTATRRDSVQAQYHVLEVKYGAGLMTRKDYCEQGLPDLRTVADSVSNEFRIGVSGLSDVMGVRRALFELMATCGVRGMPGGTGGGN
jgi:hypothetical protein